MSNSKDNKKVDKKPARFSLSKAADLLNAAIGFPGFGFNLPGAPLLTGNIPPPPEGRPYTPKDLRTVISPVQQTRLRQDVATWRYALQEAEEAWLPYRVKMQTIYMDTVLNGHVLACLNRRRRMTNQREWNIVNAKGQTDERLTEWLRGQWIEDIMTYVLDAKFYGYSLVGLGEVRDGQFDQPFVIKRWDISPDRYNVTNLPYMTSGVGFLEGEQANWHIWAAVPNEVGARWCGYGLLYPVAYYEILMRDAMSYWGDFTETYGQPLRWAQTKKTQQEPEFVRLQQAMENLGSNPWLVTDIEDKVTILQANSDNGKNGVYETFVLTCERAISKMLLGHADAMESTPGKLGATQGGQASPQQVALDEIQAEDGKFVESVMNRQFLPKLRALGFSIPKGARFQFSNNAELQEEREHDDKNATASTAWLLQLTQAGFSVDEKWLSEYLSGETDISTVQVIKASEPQAASRAQMKDLARREIMNRTA